MEDKKTNSILLEADDSEFKKKLLLPDTSPDDFDNILPLLEGRKSENEVPLKWVQLFPGICVKTRLANGEKVFVNICHTPDIPSPQQIDDETLVKMYASLNEEDSADTGICVPLSIGEGHQEEDKSGGPCTAYDVAMNSGFLERSQNSVLQRRFAVQVALEAVRDKFGLEMDVEAYTVLKNRKVLGRLPRHRIELRPPKGPLIQELGAPRAGPSTSGAAAPKEAAKQEEPKQAIKASDLEDAPRLGERRPEAVRMLRRPGPDGRPLLVADIAMADVASGSEVHVSAGEDRLVVASARRGYALDVFVPLRLDAGAARAAFVRDSRVLNVTVPILAN